MPVNEADFREATDKSVASFRAQKSAFFQTIGRFLQSPGTKAGDADTKNDVETQPAKKPEPACR
jgi:hypothetical protein